MFQKIASRYSFVILDITLKLFTLIYTLSSNYFLEKQEFNEVSFFRTTLAMVVGLTATALGYYIFNYYNSVRNDREEYSKFINLVIIIPLASILISSILIFLYPEVIGINKITSVSPIILTLIFVCSILSQVLIYLVKAIGGFEREIKKYLVLNLALMSLTVILLTSKITNIQYYILLLFYFISTILYFLVIYKSLDKKYFLKALNLKSSPFDTKFKKFYIPNFLESLLSVPRTWLSFTVFIYIIGFNNIGEILLIQMILGLFIFFCNSFVMNKYTEINCENISTRTRSLNNNTTPILILSMGMVCITILFWDLIKTILKISQITDFQILILCIATIIQAILLPLGTLFKKNNLSKLTLYHNMIFLIIFILLEYLLLMKIGETGYYWAYSISWLVILLVMAFQSIKYNVCSPKKILIMLSSIISLYYILYVFFIQANS